MLQGLVEGLVDVSVSLTKLSSRLDFFFFIAYLPDILTFSYSERSIIVLQIVLIYAYP